MSRVAWALYKKELKEFVDSSSGLSSGELVRQGRVLVDEIDQVAYEFQVRSSKMLLRAQVFSVVIVLLLLGMLVAWRLSFRNMISVLVSRMRGGQLSSIDEVSAGLPEMSRLVTECTDRSKKADRLKISKREELAYTLDQGLSLVKLVEKTEDYYIREQLKNMLAETVTIINRIREGCSDVAENSMEMMDVAKVEQKLLYLKAYLVAAEMDYGLRVSNQSDCCVSGWSVYADEPLRKHPRFQSLLYYHKQLHEMVDSEMDKSEKLARINDIDTSLVREMKWLEKFLREDV